MKDIFVGRQPIIQTNGDLYAYELLYRDGHSNQFPKVDPSTATIQVIVNAFLSPGFEQLSAQKAFVNFPEELLFTNILDTLDPTEVVIELLEDIPVSEKLIARLQQLKNAGFEIALDDFILHNELTHFPMYFHLIDYLKVDFLVASKNDQAKIEALKARFPHLTLLAEKIETKMQYEEAKHLGYELFQGYYFAKPEVVKGTVIPTEILLYFELLSQLNKEDPNIVQLIETVTRDVSLTYKLLKYANKHEYESTKKIISVRQAIMRIGLNPFKRWVRLLVLYQNQTGVSGEHAKVLANNSLFRANLCELLAVETGVQETEDYYMLGLFSLMDLILRGTSEEVFSLLPLSDEMIQTYIGKDTVYTPYLIIIEAIEKQNYKQAIAQATHLTIVETRLKELVNEALIKAK